MNRLVKLLASCDLDDISSLRRLYQNNEGNEYYLDDDIRITCEETHRSTPDIVRFIISIPMEKLIKRSQWEPWGIVVADYGLRDFYRQLESIDFERMHDTKKEAYTGKIILNEPNHKVLIRSSAYVGEGMLHFALKIRFPIHMMAKRSVVKGKISVRIVRRELAKAIRNFIAEFDEVMCMERIAVYRKQLEIREFLSEHGYVSFIANGSILPRHEQGEKPMSNAVPFISPPEDEITIALRDGTSVTGMAIKQGVTVITGGGYSGKSTLLTAMLSGIYDHVPGDGREYCIADRGSWKVAAEDGRTVTSLDITPFIRSMPGMDMTRFSTPHASGSTSQAANIMESIAFGCRVLLIDEDRTATNFMIRDTRMKSLIKNDPIIPFTDRVRQLYREAGVSTVLIIGGSSEYLDIADSVYFMEDYRIRNFGKQAEELRAHPYEYYDVKDDQPIRWRQSRVLLPGTLTTFTSNAEPGKYKEDMKIDGQRITVGDILSDVSRVESIISGEQVNAIAWICRYIAVNCAEKMIDVEAEIKALYEKIDNDGLSFMLNSALLFPDEMELPNPLDVAAAISRMSLIAYRP